jgi:iron complex outermembrane receptor protein
MTRYLASAMGIMIVGLIILNGVAVAEDTSAAPTTQNSSLGEIIVTAEKREERLQDVPVPVTAISAAELAETSQLRLPDYYATIPSLTVSQGIQSSQEINIRGLPASTFLIDDVPLSGVLPDIDPGNLDHIEVLRGPQGTLYGASSLGGLIKFVTVDPSTDGVSGRIEAGTDTIHKGYDLGYNFRGSVNLPVTQDFAVRGGGFWRQNAGYIDEPIRQINGINRDTAEGGTITGLWRPTDTFSVRLNALYQDIKGGNGDVTAINQFTGQPIGVDALQQIYAAGTGPYERKTQAFSVVLKDKVGPVELSSLTGYNQNASHDYYDITTICCGEISAKYYPGYGGAPVYTNDTGVSISEEVKASASFFNKLDVLVGGYYNHRYGTFYENLLASNLTTGAIAGSVAIFQNEQPYLEQAGFADVTYHVTDQFDIQIGGRGSHIAQAFPDAITGLGTPDFAGGVSSPYIAPTLHASSNSATYLMTPRFRISPDWMLYARLASGFSPGGANTPAAGVPPEYGPEKTKNYEIGTKGDILDHVLSLDASIYRIDFTGLIQEFYSTNKLSYLTNAGAARSEGIELNLDAHPLTGLTVSTWVVISDAHLTDIPEGVIAAETLNGGAISTPVGAPLPNSSRFSANVSLDQQFPLSGSITGFAGGTLGYMGEREGVYASTGRQIYPGYAKTDLRVGAKMNSWKANLYVNNLADRRGIVSGDDQANIPYSFYLIQPRTVGVTAARTF